MSNVTHLPDRYLTKRQVADRLGFSLRWVEQQVASGGLPARRPNGRDLRFDWAEVVAWMDKQHAGDRQETRTR